MAKFIGLLALPLLVAMAQIVLASVLIGSVFGYGALVIIIAIPVAYIPTLLVGLPVIGSAAELPWWRSAIVGMLCALPAAYVFTDWQTFGPHVLNVMLTLLSWLAAGAVLGRALVFRKGIRQVAAHDSTATSLRGPTP